MSSDFSMVLRFWIDRDFIFRVDEQRKKERGSGDFRIQVICIRSSMWGGWAEVGRGDGWKSILIRQSEHLPIPFFPLQLLRFAYTVGVRIWFLFVYVQNTNTSLIVITTSHSIPLAGLPFPHEFLPPPPRNIRIFSFNSPSPPKKFLLLFLIKFIIRRRALIDKSNEDNQILKSLTFIWKVRVTAPVSLLSIVSLFETLFSCAVQPLPTIIGVNLDACKNVEPGFCQKSPRAAFQDGAAQPDG